MCIYCDAYEEEYREEENQTSAEHNRSDRDATFHPSNEILAQVRSSVADLF